MPQSPPPNAPVPPAEALQRLRDGNLRYINNLRSLDVRLGQLARQALVAAQRPFAIILSCSDSRVPSEIVFDQGLGDLFVVRVAGNIVAPSLVGSVEFAAESFGTQLVVVMGHSRCGAVAATLDAIQKGAQVPSENIQDIVGRIRPHVEEIARAGLDPDAAMTAAIRANVRASVAHLRHGSRLLENLVSRQRLAVIGAEYSLETGTVSFLEDEGPVSRDEAA